MTEARRMHSKPVKPRLARKFFGGLSGTHALSIGAVLLGAFGFLVVCGVGVVALVPLWAQSLF